MICLSVISWRSELITLFDFVGLPKEQLQGFQECKDEELSYGEFIESGCDEGNEDQTWYPSESVVAEWKQVKEKRNEYNESLEQGNCFSQLVNLCFG